MLTSRTGGGNVDMPSAADRERPLTMHYELICVGGYDGHTVRSSMVANGSMKCRADQHHSAGNKSHGYKSSGASSLDGLLGCIIPSREFPLV
jgi:hypothetical protein